VKEWKQVVKVIWRKTVSPLQTDGSIYSPGGANVPSNVGTLAPPGEYDSTCASFGPPESTIQTANRSVHPFLHSSRQNVPILTMGSSSPKIAHFHGDKDPISHDSLGLSEPITQTASRSVQPYLHRWTQIVPILYNGRPFPLKIVPSHRGNPHLIRGSLCPPTLVLNPNGISIGSAIFSGLTSVTDQPTDYATRSVRIDRMYGRCGLIITI